MMTKRPADTGDKQSVQDQKKETYTSDRLIAVASSLRDIAAQLAVHAKAMQSEGIPSVTLGDAMLRRSYRHLSHFSTAVERAIDKHHEDRAGLPRTPW